tara:strand:- start:1023 stop:1340 length:318 start_codon:yes stop_codon:yes gene_type:complete
MITFNMPKESIIYLGGGAVVLGIWLGAYVWGIHLGAAQAQDQYQLELADCQVQLEEINTRLIDLQLELTKCKSISAGKCALDCEAIAQERVDAVLQDLKEVQCAD